MVAVYSGPLTIWIVAVLLFVLLPALLLFLGLRQYEYSSSWLGKAVSIALAIVSLGLLSVIPAFILWVSPFQDKIVTSGFSPDGREYCIVQTYKEMFAAFDPYQVSFYARDDHGTWVWYGLDHEDITWRSGEVRFEGNTAKICRDGKHDGCIEIVADLTALEREEEHFVLQHVRDAALTVDELAAWHHKVYGK